MVCLMPLLVIFLLPFKKYYNQGCYGYSFYLYAKQSTLLYILDLKGKLEFIGVGISDDQVTIEQELKDVLIGLGYKEKEIVPVLAKVDTSLKLEDQVKDALRLLLR